MAGVVGRVQLRKSLQTFLREENRQMLEHAQEKALEAGIEGLATARIVIATTESALSPGKMNRIYTGDMYTALDAKVSGTRRIHVNVGWLQNKKDYFTVQDQGGTTHWGAEVWPMHALAAAQIRMREVLAEGNIK